MGAVVIEAAASTPADPLARAAATDDAAAFAEGTQALLDRLERLGDMRDRGLLSVEEFETAKAPIVAELEARGMTVPASRGDRCHGRRRGPRDHRGLAAVRTARRLTRER